MAKLILVEDDERLAALTAAFLRQNGHQVDVLHDGESAIPAIIRKQPNLVILDVMLPNWDGYTVCRQVRNSYAGPILFLTAKDSDFDQVKGFELGGDDYVIKPAEPYVLLARVNALLRRANSRILQQETVKIGSLAIEPAARQVSLMGERVELTTQEYDLLWFLASQAGQIHSRDEIYQQVLGRQYDGLDRSVDIRICKLRKKLGDNLDNPERLVTVWGKGYMCALHAW
ncbi:winged helix-turn-helix domain-containing protein [Pseudoalteromonas fenneropenaei]|uniref:Winged helix-turn-helix domain-containing protein n=1 Tax=Pseudoalteromonas fenneropenaei TaxID=1737459 RepID=A0ABV7CJZ4_9GAMM